jgi:integrase
MSIRKRAWTKADGTKRIAWVVDYKDQHGARHIKTFKTKKNADNWEATAKVEVRGGTHTAESSSVTVAEAAKLWLERGQSEGLERGTMRYYRDMVTKHINPIVGEVSLAQLNQPAVERAKDQLLKTRSRAMTQKAIKILKGILKDAKRRGLVSQNVAQDVTVKDQARHKAAIVIPTPDEIRQMIDKAAGHWRPLLIAATFTGLRASELRGLTWDNVDLDEGVIHVRQRADRYNVMGPPKSKAGRRDIPIGKLVVNTFREWKLAVPKGDLGLVFPNGVGNVESMGNIYNRGFHPIQRACGLLVDKGETDKDGKPILRAKYGFHSLRHFYASWLIDQGFKPKQIQTMLGHSSITLTFDTYGHLLPTDEDEQAKLSAAELTVVG